MLMMQKLEARTAGLKPSKTEHVAGYMLLNLGFLGLVIYRVACKTKSQIETRKKALD